MGNSESKKRLSQENSRLKLDNQNLSYTVSELRDAVENLDAEKNCLIEVKKNLHSENRALKAKAEKDEQIIKELKEETTLLHVQMHQIEERFEERMRLMSNNFEEKMRLMGNDVEEKMQVLLQEHVKEQGSESLSARHKEQHKKLERRIHRREINMLARNFDNPELYLNPMGLEPSDQTDVRNAIARDGAYYGMIKCLSIWQQRNPSEATFGNLIKMAKDLGREDTAKRIQDQFGIGSPE